MIGQLKSKNNQLLKDQEQRKPGDQSEQEGSSREGLLKMIGILKRKNDELLKAQEEKKIGDQSDLDGSSRESLLKMIGQLKSKNDELLKAQEERKPGDQSEQEGSSRESLLKMIGLLKSKNDELLKAQEERRPEDQSELVKGSRVRSNEKIPQCQQGKLMYVVLCWFLCIFIFCKDMDLSLAWKYLATIKNGLTTLKTMIATEGQPKIEQRMKGKQKIEERSLTSLTINKKTGNDYLRILQNLKKSFSSIRDLEVETLNNFTTEYRKIINEASVSVNFEVSKLKQIIIGLQNEKAQNTKELENTRQSYFSLQKQSSQIKKENEKLRKNIESDKIARRNIRRELQELKADCTEKSSLDSCEKELRSEKGKYDGLFPQISQIGQSSQSIKKDISKLIQGFKSYKNLYQQQLKKNQKNQVEIRKYHNLILIEKKKVIKLGEMVKSSVSRQDSCQTMRKSLSSALQAVRKYKSAAESQEDELGYCEKQNAEYKKVLRSTNTFYSYLLQKSSLLTAGIRHQKIVGENLRFVWLAY